MAIEGIKARTVYDSRGNPTVEVDLTTEKGMFRAIVPSGASTGIYEAVELRDKGSKWGGKGVTQAVDNVNSIIAPKLVGNNVDITNQQSIDKILNDLDGTDNKSKLGANAILGVSLAACKAAAAHKNVPLFEHIADISGTSKPFVLPVPSMNVLNGGSHAGGQLAFQEFMIFPSGASTFSEAMRWGSETYHILKKLAIQKYGSGAGNVGDEGGVAPEIQTAEEALDLITESIEKAGYTGKVRIAMDPASSEFYQNGKYNLDYKSDKPDPKKSISSKQLADIYIGLAKKYDIVSIEDPFDQDDWEAWTHMVANCDFQIMGDDLTVTNTKRIQTAIDKKCCSSLLLKINQIGTITEAIEAANMAKAAGWSVMVSHRSGETEDSSIADIVVGLSTGQIKSGAPARGERMAKYNQLLRIEEQLGSNGIYAGAKYLRTKADLK